MYLTTGCKVRPRTLMVLVLWAPQITMDHQWVPWYKNLAELHSYTKWRQYLTLGIIFASTMAKQTSARHTRNLHKFLLCLWAQNMLYGTFDLWRLYESTLYNRLSIFATRLDWWRTAWRDITSLEYRECGIDNAVDIRGANSKADLLPQETACMVMGHSSQFIHIIFNI